MLSRRSFVRSLGAGGAGALAIPLLAARGHEAEAAALNTLYRAPGAGRPLSHEAAERARRLAPHALRLDSNENPMGPGPASLAALRSIFGEIPRYPDLPGTALLHAIARAHGAANEGVVLGCGSSEILRMAVYAHCARGQALVTAAPTFEDPVGHAERLGAPIRAIRVRPDLSLDLDAMASAARGAGLVFLCNPNNPTGGVHGGGDIAEFVRGVIRDNPDVTVMVDEAYHEYVDTPGYATAMPLALELPRVVVARTFSKLHGIAGLRVGYAVGRPETIALLAPHKLGANVNVLGAAAALAALADPEHVARERARNREARDFTRRWFEKAGYPVAPAAANFLMADIGRPAKQFQEACASQGVLVGRPFPPLESRARVSIGTLAEMRKAVGVFERVLGTGAAAR